VSKALSAELQAHLDGGATTMALCWLVVRTDGTRQGFTEHDRDLTFGGDTYLASSGFTASRLEQSLGLAVDNLNVDGALSDDSINEDDLAEGRYDDADVTLTYVNWADTSMRTILSRGSIGEVKRQETAFSAEFRSLAHKLNQRTGRTFQRTCDAALGDARCGVDLTSSSYRSNGAVISASGRSLVVDTVGDFYPDAFFTHGVLTFTSGDNNGLSFEVKSQAGGNITLWQVPPNPVNAPNTFFVTAGCEKTIGVCKAKFDNVANFRGCPYIPGQDIFQDYPTQGDPQMDGGSLFQ